MESHKTDESESEECIRFLFQFRPQRVALQFPDPMLKEAVHVEHEFVRLAAGPSVCFVLAHCPLALDAAWTVRFYILADTSYGSCCVDEIAADHVKADAIVHFGPSCLSSYVFHVSFSSSSHNPVGPTARSRSFSCAEGVQLQLLLF